MYAIAVSDIHLGWKEGENPRIIDFLDWVSRMRPDYFLLLGDIVEEWRRDILAAFVEHAHFFSLITDISKDTQVVMIAGNHDWHLINLTEKWYAYPFAFRETFKIPIDGIEYKFLHGHQYDPFNMSGKLNEAMCHSTDEMGAKMADWWARNLAGPKYRPTIASKMRASRPRFGYSPFISLTVPTAKNLEQTHNPNSIKYDLDLHDQMKRNAARDKKENEFIVYAHSHAPYVDKTAMLANSGSWCEGASDYIEIWDKIINVREF